MNKFVCFMAVGLVFTVLQRDKVQEIVLMCKSRRDFANRALRDKVRVRCAVTAVVRKYLAPRARTDPAELVVLLYLNL